MHGDPPAPQGQGLRMKAGLPGVGIRVGTAPIVRAGTKPSTSHPKRGLALVLGPAPRTFRCPFRGGWPSVGAPWA